MDSFPSATSIKQLHLEKYSRQSKEFIRQSTKIHKNIEEAVNRNDSNASVFLDPIHPQIIPFLKEKGYKVSTRASTDRYGEMDGTYLSIKW